MNLEETQKSSSTLTTDVKVSINSMPNKAISQELEPWDQWEEILQHFATINGSNTGNNMDVPVTKFYSGNKFGLFIDLPSLKDRKMHGSSIWLVHTKDGVHLAIQRMGWRLESGSITCHIFILADAQMNIQNNELVSIQYW